MSEEEQEQDTRKPQLIVSVFKEFRDVEINGQVLHYPELDELIHEGFYIESFQQSLISDTRFVVTFSMKKFNMSTY